jgi:hypothetical protein
LTRRLLIAWPGDAHCQQGVWNWLTLTGLAEHCDFALQINSFLSGENGFPHKLTNDRINAADAAHRCMNRDWHPRLPTHAYYDHEPSYTLPNGNKRSWRWTAWNRPIDAEDCRIIQHARQELEEWQEPYGYGMSLAVYGFPLAIGSHPRPYDHELDTHRWVACRQLVKGFGWLYMSLYPPAGVVPPDYMEDTSNHERRAATNYATACAMWKGQPTVPFLWPRWGMDAAKYGDTYCGALANAGCERLGLWINPHSDGMTRVYLQALTDMLPALRRFVGVN